MKAVDQVVRMVAEIANDQSGTYQESFRFAFFYNSYFKEEDLRNDLVGRFGENGSIFDMLEYINKASRRQEEFYWMWQESH